MGRKRESVEANALERAYAILTILDDKANGLMTVNAFLGAYPLLAIDHFKDVHTVTGKGAVLLSAVLVFLLLASAALCFFVVRVEWPFLEHISRRDGDNFADDELRNLSKVIGIRSSRYRWAWRITFACLVGLVILAIVYTAI